MSMASFERGIIWHARDQLKRPSLKLKELMEWSTAEIKPQDDTEETFFIDADKVWATFKKPVKKEKKSG